MSDRFRYRVRSILKREGMADRFEVIVGAEEMEVHEPDPAGMLSTLGKMARLPAEVLHAGDSVVDGKTARRAGVAFVAVPSGVTPEAAIRACEPKATLRDPRELPALPGGRCGPSATNGRTRPGLTKRRCLPSISVIMWRAMRRIPIP